jgi:hypothetical protein
MWSLVRLIDGDVPKSTNTHACFVAGVFLGALRRHGHQVALDAAQAKADQDHKDARAKADATWHAGIEKKIKEGVERVLGGSAKPTTTARDRERAARDEMERQSKESWTKKSK